MNFTPKVLVVSNSMTTGPLWAYSLQEKNFEVVMEPNPTKILRRWAEEVPNLIVVDINSVEPTLLAMISTLREESVVPVIFLTQNKPEEYILQAYDAGVDECVIKPISPSLFHAKIKAWLRRSSSVPMYALDPLKVGRVTLVPAERAVIVDDKGPIHLTNLELRLFYLLMGRPGRTVSAEEIIEKVWGYGEEADNTVLKNTIYRLRKKIELDPSNPLIIQTVASVGYRFIPE